MRENGSTVEREEALGMRVTDTRAGRTAADARPAAGTATVAPDAERRPAAAPVATTAEVHQGFAAIAPEWDALADATAAVPFIRPGWVQAWWESFGDGEPLTLAVRREGDLAAVIPLCRTGGVLESPTNWHTPLFGFVAADEDARADLYRHVAAAAGRRLALGFLPADEQTDALRATLAGSRRVTVRRLGRSPYVLTTRDEAAYSEALPRGRRKSLRRQRRRLAEAGDLSFEVNRDLGEGDALLAEALSIEASGWKGRHGIRDRLGSGDAALLYADRTLGRPTTAGCVSASCGSTAARWPSTCRSSTPAPGIR